MLFNLDLAKMKVLYVLHFVFVVVVVEELVLSINENVQVLLVVLSSKET